MFGRNSYVGQPQSVGTWQGAPRRGMTGLQRRRGIARSLFGAALLFSVLPRTVLPASASVARNGHAGPLWQVAKSPDLAGRLVSVSCPGLSFCMTVGHTDNGAGIIELWQGKSWTSLPIPTFAKSVLPTGVSCPSVTSCIVVGQESQGGPMAMRYTRGAWHDFALPNLVGGFDGGLVGVSCAGLSWCMAVGSGLGDAKPYSEGFAYSYNGRTWSLSKVAQPKYGSLLDGAYCSALSPPSCVAVGLRFSEYPVGSPPPDAVPYTLIEEFNGNSWVRPSGPVLAGRLMGVSCLASGCLAVGINQVGRNQVGVALTKNTNGWTTGTPAQAYARDPLLSVSCELRTQCVAVGDDGHSNGVAILSWKEGWSSFRAPVVALPAGLVDVSCLSRTVARPFCVAVGFESNGLHGSMRTLVLRME